MLSHRAGLQHLDAIEDAVQSALMAALETWPKQGEPDNPSAWLYRSAYNNLMTELRQAARRSRILEQHPAEQAEIPETDIVLPDAVEDDMLRMLFACCDDAVPGESQLVFALKTLCGFSIPEIALRLFITEANAYKRYTRASGRLQTTELLTDVNTDGVFRSRLPAVRKVLYLLFTEGYLSAHPEQAIREELCDEAIRLTVLLATHPLGNDPETAALLALMYLHRARFKGRQGTGGLLLLEEQDRSLWDRNEIQCGLEWLARAAAGDRFSRYHAEAGIAAEHCLAPSFRETRWDRVAECYELLEQTSPSQIHTLNRAVAVAEWKGAAAGLAVLESLEPTSRIVKSYLWCAVLSDLHRRNENVGKARQYAEEAFALAPNQVMKDLLLRRLGAANQVENGKQRA